MLYVNLLSGLHFREYSTCGYELRSSCSPRQYIPNFSCLLAIDECTSCSKHLILISQWKKLINQCRIIAAAKSAENELISEASKHRYKKVYEDFMKWKTLNKAKEISETVIMAYFYELSPKLKPSSLWAYYSMIKCILKLNDNIDISSYHKVTAFLKDKSSGYKPVKAKVFTVEEIDKFISNAPDSEWLDVKVASIFAISGALLTEQLTRITVGDIEKHGNLLLVQILQSRTNVPRSFAISGKFYDVVQKYAALRCPRTVDQRFFVNYRDEKCTTQVIGRQKFSKMPARIAAYLKLPEAKSYLGNSFRRTSGTILANSGATMERTKRYGAWHSSTVAEGYVDESPNHKKKTGDPITSTIKSCTIHATQCYTADNVKDDSEIPSEELVETSGSEGKMLCPLQPITTNIVKVSGVSFRTNIPLEEVCDTENTLEITPIDDLMFHLELCNVSYLNETCRVCLKDLRSSVNKISFFNDLGEISAEIAKILTALQSMNVEVRRDDTVPPQVCMECYNIFSKMTLFRKICERSKRALDNIRAFTTEQLRNKKTDDNSDILFDTWAEIKVEPLEGEEASLPFDNHRIEEDKIQNRFQNDDSNDERQNCREEISTLQDESCVDEELPNLDEFNYHEDSRDNSRTIGGLYRCPFCEQRFDSLKQLGLHTKMDHLNKMYKCPHCPKAYRLNDSLKSHILTHNPVREHKCTFCEKEFFLKHCLVSHLRSHTKVNPFLCNFCAKKFRWEQSLKDHLSSHDPKLYPRGKKCIKPPQETRQCTQCSYTSNCKGNMKKHMANYHDPANPRRDFEFSCHICDKQFKIRISLEKHLETHKEVRDHHCTQCKASFKEACTLKLHIEGVHLKLKPHKCDQCNAAYIVSSDLKRHKMQKHSTERPFQCCYCKKAFATKIALKLHIKLHDRSNKGLIFI